MSLLPFLVLPHPSSLFSSSSSLLPHLSLNHVPPSLLLTPLSHVSPIPTPSLHLLRPQPHPIPPTPTPSPSPPSYIYTPPSPPPFPTASTQRRYFDKPAAKTPIMRRLSARRLLTGARQYCSLCPSITDTLGERAPHAHREGPPAISLHSPPNALLASSTRSARSSR